MSSFRAYGKINLGLLVLEKRPDNYHNIETVFHRVNLFDEITLSPSHEITVESSSKEVPRDKHNICHKAATLLKQQLDINTGVSIAITKKIPVGAGLGGGSSNAAAVLRHLPSFWGKTLGELASRSLALELGSDVPYFMSRGSALARGRGEMLEYFQLDVPYAILLCDPGIHISTTWAYQHVKPHLWSLDLKNLIIRGMQEPSVLSSLRNDFEDTVLEHHPPIAHIKETMLRSGAVLSLMSGSGSSVYGLYENDHGMHEATTALNALGYKTYFTQPHFSADGP